MRRYVRRSLVLAVGLLVMLLAGASSAIAAPKAPPSYGVQNPQGLDGCWHPDPVKCFTTGWAGEFEVHIVADPFEGDGTGTVTFWCQSIVGFKYQISVAGLEPRTMYTVTTSGSFETTLGTFRTDPRGYGTLNGLMPLPPGEYHLFLEVRDPGNNIVLDTYGDLQGFGVFPH